MKKFLILVCVLSVASAAVADLNPNRVLPTEITGRYASNNITSYWGMTPDEVIDRTGLVDPAEELHNKVASDGAMFEKRDWNAWNTPYCEYQTNDHPFFPGDAGTSNPNFIGNTYPGFTAEANWVRDKPDRTNPDVASQWQDGYEYNCTLAWLMYEFDGPKTLDSMFVWNFNEGGDQQRGWQSVDIHYTTDGITWNLLYGPEYDSGFRFNPADGSDPFAATDLIDLQDITATAIVLTAYSDWTDSGMQTAGWGVTNTGGGYSGVMELQFNEVPEPATMGLLTLGALILRKRR